MKWRSDLLGWWLFWCMEAVFQRIEGVTEVSSGYMGGRIKTQLIGKFAVVSQDMSRL